MVVEPDHTVYSHLTRETAKAVYHGEMGDGEKQPHLELTEEELRAFRK
jgi:hypothetical protein